MWSWNSRLGLQMKHAAPAPKGAWHVGAADHAVDRIPRSLRMAMLSDTDRWRWAPRLPSATSFENSPKRSCDSHIVCPVL